MSPLARLLGSGAPVARVRLDTVHGSSPREAGAEMFVTEHGMTGTIGGGQLEYIALDEARALLASGADSRRLDVPLGPQIGQCCGGRVGIAILRMDDAARQAALAAEAEATARLPHVLVFGAGHVGRALAAALALLPLRVTLVDGRAEELGLATDAVGHRLTPLPEAVVREAVPGSAFVVLTHDHSLDFLITREALARGDAAYVGMIGSATKRTLFRRWCGTAEGPAVDTARLVCPIGAGWSPDRDPDQRPDQRPDKRPEVIAAFVAAEVMAALAAHAGHGSGTGSGTGAETVQGGRR